MENNNPLSNVSDELGGKPEAPKKELKHIHTEKAKSGGHIHTYTRFYTSGTS